MGFVLFRRTQADSCACVHMNVCIVRIMMKGCVYIAVAWYQRNATNHSELVINWARSIFDSYLLLLLLYDRGKEGSHTGLSLINPHTHTEYISIRLFYQLLTAFFLYCHFSSWITRNRLYKELGCHSHPAKYIIFHMKFLILFVVFFLFYRFRLPGRKWREKESSGWTASSSCSAAKLGPSYICHRHC